MGGVLCYLLFPDNFLKYYFPRVPGIETYNLNVLPESIIIIVFHQAPAIFTLKCHLQNYLNNWTS